MTDIYLTEVLVEISWRFESWNGSKTAADG